MKRNLIASAAAVAVFAGSIPYEKPPKGPAYGPRFLYCGQCKKRMSKHHKCPPLDLSKWSEHHED